jgi:Xaa-Pro dipeptidase
MALHFTREEFTERQHKTRAALARQGLDGLLIFRQESMYWLTGYDTEGFVLFQGLYFGADGRMALCTRSADERQSKLTSVIEDVRIWRDQEGANPAIDLRAMVEDLGGRGKRLGVEYHAYGLTGQHAKRVDAAFDGFATLVDASDIIRVLRLVKSPAELVYMRKAGKLADKALGIANRITVPGQSVGAIYGKMMDVVLSSDGDPSASRWPMGGGEDALFVRYHTGHGKVAKTDQVLFEFAASYRHYHAALMNVVLTGAVDERQRDMFRACREALDACQDVLRPGRTVGEIFDTHARVLTKSGFGKSYLNACGYTMGATYPPSWMDWPMCVTGNPQILEPGMVFFLHMILLDKDTGLSMSLGEQAIVTKAACEKITHAPQRLIVNGGGARRRAVRSRRVKSRGAAVRARPSSRRKKARRSG